MTTIGNISPVPQRRIPCLQGGAAFSLSLGPGYFGSGPLALVSFPSRAFRPGYYELGCHGPARRTGGAGCQAVQRQRGDVLGPAAGVDEDLGRGADVRSGRDRQVLADLPHDLDGQVPAGLAVPGFVRGVGAVHGELVAQSFRGSARLRTPRAEARFPPVWRPLHQNVPAAPGADAGQRLHGGRAAARRLPA
jgi:hypothetical protein